MAHSNQQQWCSNLSKLFPQYFINRRVLDIGSLDINGNNKYLFVDCEYVGLDIIEGENVDVVSIAHEYSPSEKFDVVLSTNALEHDMYYEKTLYKMVELSREFMFFTIPVGLQVHGTKERSPLDSPTSQMGPPWENYYHALSEQDIRNVLDLDSIFSKYLIEVINIDLFFWGIK